jgi:hypothetical protein
MNNTQVKVANFSISCNTAVNAELFVISTPRVELELF